MGITDRRVYWGVGGCEGEGDDFKRLRSVSFFFLFLLFLIKAYGVSSVTKATRAKHQESTSGCASMTSSVTPLVTAVFRRVSSLVRGTIIRDTIPSQQCIIDRDGFES